MLHELDRKRERQVVTQRYLPEGHGPTRSRAPSPRPPRAPGLSRKHLFRLGSEAVRHSLPLLDARPFGFEQGLQHTDTGESGAALLGLGIQLGDTTLQQGDQGASVPGRFRGLERHFERRGLSLPYVLPCGTCARSYGTPYVRSYGTPYVRSYVLPYGIAAV